MAPPLPRLFQAIALLGVMVGSMGALSAVGNLGLLSRAEHALRAPSGIEPRTDAELEVARRVHAKLDHVIERHRGKAVALQLANAALSLLLLVGGLTLSSGRAWSHGVMLQAIAASGLYELPAAAHELWLAYDKVAALTRLPELSEKALLTGQQDNLAAAELSFVIVGVVVALGLTVLRLAYYGAGLWYLRRRDVRAWFQASRDM